MRLHKLIRKLFPRSIKLIIKEAQASLLDYIDDLAKEIKNKNGK